MAYLKAYKTGMGGTNDECDEMHFADTREAMRSASSLMAMEVEPFTTPSGAVSVKPYCKVDVFDNSDNYITTAWGE